MQSHEVIDIGFGQAALPPAWVMNASINWVGPADPEVCLPRRPGQAATSLYPSVNVTISEHSNPQITLAELQQGQSAKLAAQLPKYRWVQDGTLARRDGLSLPFMMYDFALPTGTLLRQAQAIALQGNVVVFVTGTAPAQTFAGHWPALMTVMQSYVPKASLLVSLHGSE